MTRAHKVSLKNSIVKSFGLGAGCKKIKSWSLDGARKEKHAEESPSDGTETCACMLAQWVNFRIPSNRRI